MAHILVVDDQKNMRTTLRLLLGAAGHEVDEAPDAYAALSRVKSDRYDLVLTDLKLGERDGIDLLRDVREAAPGTPVMLMTAFGSIETAVESMKIGALDYMQKPFREDELLARVELLTSGTSAKPPPAAVASSEPPARANRFRLIGDSPAMQDIVARIERIAPVDATVLITGESGTGKELVARAIHAGSQRSDRPFVTVNCAAINETLLESELFGHVRGAYTGAITTRKGLFEEANGGTFFFDEIAETPPTVQAKLLRAIQEGEIRRLGENRPIRVDVRLIAATNQDLPTAIAEKRFRKDLYYRLNVARFSLPPLRERPGDIAALITHFLGRYSRKLGREIQLGKGVEAFLLAYPFPGNVRELENMMEQGVALSPDGVLRLADMQPDEALLDDRVTSPRADAPLQDVVEEAERAHIQRALAQVEGSKEKAAEMLGLSPTTLWRKMKRLNVVYP